MKGQLPKAYLRIDPELPFTHPDPAAFMKLLSIASKQPRRGRFKEFALIEKGLGKAAAKRLRDRGDVIETPAGWWYVDGWDHWQEGDLDVGQRMRLMRERRNEGRNGAVTESVTGGVTNAVTEGVTKPSPPSEASGVRRQASRRQTFLPEQSESERASLEHPPPPPDRPPGPAAELLLAALDHDAAVTWEAELAWRCVGLELLEAQLEQRAPTVEGAQRMLEALSATPRGQPITTIRGAPRAWCEQSLRTADRFEYELRWAEDGAPGRDAREEGIDV